MTGQISTGPVSLMPSPLDLIDAVGAPVGHFAAGIIAPSHPAKLQLRIERPRLGRSLPGVPIVAFGHGLGRQAGVTLRSGIIHSLHVLNFPSPPLADEFASDAIHFHRPLLAADLEHPIVLAGRVDDRSAFGDIDRQRLFRVHVLAGLTGENGDRARA